MRARIGGNSYAIRFRCIPGIWAGKCDDPTTPPEDREIVIDPRVDEKETLETIIHEALHAFDWEASEEYVLKAGEDISRLLWRLGYRRGKQTKKRKR